MTGGNINDVTQLGGLPYQFWEVVIVRLSIAVGAVAGATPAVTASHVHVVLASVPARKKIIFYCDWHNVDPNTGGI